jgi:hypothetical protein
MDRSAPEVSVASSVQESSPMTQSQSLKRKAETDPPGASTQSAASITASENIKPSKRQKKNANPDTKKANPQKSKTTPAKPKNTKKVPALLKILNKTRSLPKIVKKTPAILRKNAVIADPVLPVTAKDVEPMQIVTAEDVTATKVSKPKKFLNPGLTITVPPPVPMDVDSDLDSPSFHGSPIGSSCHGSPTTSSSHSSPAGSSSPLTPLSARNKKKAAVPSTPPAEAFNCPIPSKVADWALSCPAPTETFTSVVDCPVNWDYVRARTEGLNDGHIQAYVLRAPWNPEDTQMPFGTVLKKINESGVTSINVEEAVRKRFRMANIKLYEATGVYFEYNVKGLDKKYGLVARKDRFKGKKASNVGPKPKESVDSFSYRTNGVHKLEPAPTYRFFLQPPKQENTDRCEKCCDEGSCYDKGCREDGCCSKCCEEQWLCNKCRACGSHQRKCTDLSCGDVMCQCPCKHNPVPMNPHHSVKGWRAHLRQRRAPFGCPDHEPLIVRDVFQGLLDKVSNLAFREMTVLRVEPKAFDIFASCIVHGPQNGVPRRLVRLWRQDPEDEFEEMAYEDAGDEYTVGDLLKAYCCSQTLQCPSVSATILNQLFIILKDEDQVNGSTQSFNMRILDFQPEDINHVFCNTANEDPIRQLLLDILTYKKENGRGKVQDHEAKYHPEFLKLWVARELQRKQGEIDAAIRGLDHIKQMRETGAAEAAVCDHQTKLAEEHIAALQKEHRLGPMRKQIFDLHGKAEAQRNTKSLIGYFAHVDVDMCKFQESIDVASQSYIWGTCRFRGWVPKEDVDRVAPSWNKAIDKTQTWTCLFSKDEALFCHNYHVDCLEDASCLHEVTVAPVLRSPSPAPREFFDDDYDDE